MGVGDYIMDYKYMLFLVPSQKYFKLVFEFSYIIVAKCYEV